MARKKIHKKTVRSKNTVVKSTPKAATKHVFLKTFLVFCIFVMVLFSLNWLFTEDYQRYSVASPSSSPDDFYKPIIYLYPQESTEVNVKVGYPEKFTHTYPKYTNGWHVLAQPNGDLTDLQTGRHLYALYWEGLNASQNTAPDGFIVKGSDTITFLEEKLAMLGLTEREANEFIIYWLPKLENNPYNLIRFQSLAQQNKNMPLNITPAPNTLIRVMMEYKPLNEKVELPEQILPSTPARTGFTVVEWGGTELNKE